MLYKYILIFLGLYSWEFKTNNLFEELTVRQNKYYETFKFTPLKNIKKLTSYIQQGDSNSPTINLQIIPLKPNNNFNFFKLVIYNIYSLFIFLLLCVQPSYLFYQLVSNNYDNIEEYLITFLLNINTPINYLWAKYYFKTNHFDFYNKDCTTNCSLNIVIIITCVMISIFINMISINSFYNQYYYLYHLEKYQAILFALIEWIYARTTLGLTSSSFTIVMCKHIKSINDFIKNVKNNEINLMNDDNNNYLGAIIKKISDLQRSIDNTIECYNRLLSFITVTCGISLALFIRHKQGTYSYGEIIVTFTNNTITNELFEDHDYYLIQIFSLYIFFQIIFFWSVIRYSQLRNDIIKVLESPEFIHRYLTRWSADKIKRKCKDDNYIKYLTRMLICIEEENSTTIDWLVIHKLCKSQWMDFSILGISTQDGSLIKKVITFSSIIYFVLSYL